MELTYNFKQMEGVQKGWLTDTCLSARDAFR